MTARRRRRRRGDRARLLAVAATAAITLVSVLVGQGPVAAATDTVTTCSGSGPGSLPAVVEGAAPGDTVTFSSSLAACPGHVITLTHALDVTTDLTIDGPGPTTLGVNGNNVVGDFDVAPGVTATISGLTIEGGGDNYDGGGIYNNGTLTVADSVLRANNSGVGGAISNVGGTLTVTDSTVTGNSANDVAGGIWNDSGSVLTVADSTLSYDNAEAGGGIWNEGEATVVDNTLSGDNTDMNDGGAILNYGTLTLSGSTLSGNYGGGIDNGGVASLAATIVANSSLGPDCSGSITDAGYNLDDDDSCGLSGADHSQSDVNPDLGPLENNGGLTATEAPAPGSPALDQIPLGTTALGTMLCPGVDQRGVTRPQGTACDIGAVDLVPVPPAITSPDAVTFTVGIPQSFTVTTTGIPVPSLIEKGRLLYHLTFVDNGDGTATLSGTPAKRGVRHVTITATFGRPSPVVQDFTLTVVPRPRRAPNTP
jgi:hypothetical protein